MDDGTTTSEAINEGGSNCPQDKVESVTQTDDDTLSSYKTTILLGNAKIETPTNQPLSSVSDRTFQPRTTL